MERQIIISEKFMRRYEKLNILNQEATQCKRYQGSGYIKKIEKDLYVIFDGRGSNGIGILDPNTFWEAVLATEISNFWDFNRKGVLN